MNMIPDINAEKPTGTLGTTSFLITGDAEAESEAQMTASGLNLDSDVYVMGHHGSGTSTSWDLLQAAVPEFAILSCGAGNSYGHPHIESMEKLEVMEKINREPLSLPAMEPLLHGMLNHAMTILPAIPTTSRQNLLLT